MADAGESMMELEKGPSPARAALRLMRGPRLTVSRTILSVSLEKMEAVGLSLARVSSVGTLVVKSP
eukprot:3025369-Rhodomonas_salina.1